MPNTIHIEVLEGKEGAETPDAKKSSVTPPKQDDTEVSGHHWTTRYMRCFRCGGITYVEYDTRHYHTYTCCHCGAYNVF